MRSLIFLLLIGQGIWGYSQYFGFNSLYIIPSNPTSLDTIGVVCSSYHGSGPCDLTNAQVSWYENTITIDAHHNPGMLTYICNTIDTIWLGVVGEGNFVIHYNLIEHFMSGPTYIASDTLFLNIISTGIPGYMFPGVSVHIDNAAHALTFIIAEEILDASVQVIDLCGRRLHRQRLGLGTNIVSTHSLRPGIYIFRLESSSGIYSKKFLVSH